MRARVLDVRAQGSGRLGPIFLGDVRSSADRLIYLWDALSWHTPRDMEPLLKFFQDLAERKLESHSQWVAKHTRQTKP